jgi:hypothetical protein
MKELFDNSFDAEVSNASDKGHRLFIPLAYIATCDTDLPFVLNQRQYSVVTALTTALRQI